MGSKRLALFMTLTFDLPAAEAQRPVVETRSSVLFINVRTSTGKKSVCMALTSDRIGSDRIGIGITRDLYIASFRRYCTNVT